MKKSLRQLLLVGLSASLLVSVAPLAFAEETTSEEASEQVEAPEEMSEESVAEEVDVEASEVQMGVDEALNILTTDYPEAEIEEIDVAYDIDDMRYDITINAFTADEDLELEVVWQNNEVVESEFNGGLFDFLEGDESAEETAEESIDTDVIDPVTEDPATETTVDEAAETMPESTVEESTLEDTVVDPAMSEEERLTLDIESLISIDEATELALGEVENGDVVRWNLTADTSEFWDFLTPEDEQDEGPIWTLNVQVPEALMDEEVRIDATAGTVIDSPEQEEEESAAEEAADPAEEIISDDSVVEEAPEDSASE